MDIQKTNPDGSTVKVGMPAITGTSPEVAIAALPLFQAGKSPAEIVKALQSQGVEDPGDPEVKAKQEAEAAENQKIDITLKYRYLMAKARLVTGQINGLSLDDLDDISCLTITPVVPYEAWVINKGYMTPPTE
jgi:hypothetical protein